VTNPIGARTSEDLTETGESTFRVGTLVYTYRGLVIVFFWMLFGDFCFTMMEGVVPTLVPVMLKDISISNATIGLVAGTIPNVLNLLFAPVVSYRSDRHRGRWGRRIPYLVLFSPIVAGCVVLTGYAPSIGAWLHGMLVAWFGPISKGQINFFSVAVCSILFQFFNVFVYYVYYYLFNDVIPQQFLGRFYALFRVVGAGGGIVFSRYFLGAAEKHPHAVFLSIAIIYLSVFLVMSWRVKEGEYPPPAPAVDGGSRFSGVRTFIRECFFVRFYWTLYAAFGLSTAGGSGILLFRILLAKNMGMTLDDYGKILSWGSVISVILFYPFGWLADRIHPMRLSLIGFMVTLTVGLGSALGIRSETSFFVWTTLAAVAAALAVSASGPLLPAILPKTQFGQFTSAVSLTQSVFVIVSNYAVGIVVDRTGSYKVIYWWSAVLTAISLVLWLVLYRDWVRLGGSQHYVAPIYEDMRGENAVESEDDSGVNIGGEGSRR
jgi:maltose/moltooligosaccharide transporter